SPAQPAPMPRACGTPAVYGTPAVQPCPVPCPSNGSGYAVPSPCVPQSGWSPAQPANVPANEFGMMADVFGQMLGAKQPPQYLPPAPALTLPQVAVQTLGFTMPPQVPEGTCPPCPLPASTRPSITGTWVREVGPVVYIIKITPDHLTITTHTATEVEDGKTIADGMVLTADYHLSRDGSTLVGLITGVDATLDGELPDGGEMMHVQGELAALQKAFTDKPFALGVRVYGDALVIGNVRLPVAEGSRADYTPIAILGGRYRNAGDKMLPKPRAMKPGPRPVPAARTPAPVYESPYAPAPAWSAPAPQPGDRIPPMPDRIPPTAVTPAPALECTPPRAPRATEPAVPPMATPTPPSEPRAGGKPVATEMTTLWKNRVEHYPDPTRNGENVAGLSGQLFLYGPAMQPASAEGELKITLHDDTPRPAGLPGGEPECWIIGSDSLRRAAVKDERFGECYALFLPWQSRRSDVTRVRLAITFQPKDGPTLHGTETRLTLDMGIKPDVSSGSAETAKPEETETRQAADRRMRELLYQSETTGPIGTPAEPKAKKKKKHLTPERIHGGILLNQYSS
ncbi:MAG TPA: hypothetical protein VM529_21240, partial [Gemmata sp.]|nr:hypothetical protein [Gemmata sp.]